MNAAALVESVAVPTENLRCSGVSTDIERLESLEKYREGEKDGVVDKGGEVNEAEFEKVGTGIEGLEW